MDQTKKIKNWYRPEIKYQRLHMGQTEHTQFRYGADRGDQQRCRVRPNRLNGSDPFQLMGQTKQLDIKNCSEYELVRISDPVCATQISPDYASVVSADTQIGNN